MKFQLYENLTIFDLFIYQIVNGGFSFFTVFREFQWIDCNTWEHAKHIGQLVTGIFRDFLFLIVLWAQAEMADGKTNFSNFLMKFGLDAKRRI